MFERCPRPYFRLIRLIGVIVPRRLRADWRQEWEAELLCREALLADWDRLDWRNKLDLLRRSVGAFRDALLLQPRRLEDEMFQDLRFGALMLAKNPGFTMAAVLCLALGIGANTTIFSMVSAFLLRPTPGSEPERLVTIGRGERLSPISYPDYLALRDGSRTLSGLAVLYEPMPMSLGDGDRSELVFGEVVSGNYFEVLGIQPFRGRMFLREEDRIPGAHPVAVISHNLWQNRLGSDPDLVGKTVRLNGRPFTLIGIVAPGFTGPFITTTIDLWVPSMMLEQAVPGHRIGLNDRSHQSWEPIGRLNPGVPLEQAQAELETINRQIEQASPLQPGQQTGSGEDRSLRLNRQRGIPLPHMRRWATLLATMLAAVVGIVLLIACANVANLLLARASIRRREIAIRLAIGASRWRLIRQLLTESILLALLGAGAGLVLAFWLNRSFMAFRPPTPPPFTYSIDLRLDAQVLVFTLLLALATGLIFGLVPALQGSRVDLVQALKDEGVSEMRRKRRLNLRGGLVVGQIAISLVLLIVAGLFIRSLQRLQTVDPGFGIRNGITLSFRFGLQGYDRTKGASFMRQIIERTSALPGIEAASAVNFLPLSNEHREVPVAAPGGDPQVSRAGLQIIGLDYFRTMELPLLRGRDFSERDAASAPKVTIINEALAERLFPGGEALGQLIRSGGSDGVNYEVVGVVKNTAYNFVGEMEPRPVVYRPFTQEYSPTMSLIARTAGDPGAVISAVRSEVRALDPNMPARDLKSLSEHISSSFWPSRMLAALMSLFGLLTLALASVGIYGVVSYSVTLRTREIGLRMALGARRPDVLKLIVKQGMFLTMTGAAIGLLLALAVTRLLRIALFGLSPVDPTTFAVVSLFLMGVALVACYIPARRAARVDPMAALRHE
jgi:predicted permease